jgi:hypothetical protein
MQARKWEDLVFIGQLFCIWTTQGRDSPERCTVLFLLGAGEVDEKKGGSQEGGGGKSFA